MSFNKSFLMFYCLYSSNSAMLILAFHLFIQSHGKYQQLYAITVIRPREIERCFSTYCLVRLLRAQLQKESENILWALGIASCLRLDQETIHGLVNIIKNERTWTNGDESFKYSCVQVNIMNKNIEAGKCRMYSEHREQFTCGKIL